MPITPLRVAPGPLGYPLVGVFTKARRNPLGFFLACAQRHGDVTSMWLGRQHVYLLSHPEHVKLLLQDDAHSYAKGPPAAPVRGLFGASLTVLDGERWRVRRRQAQSVFHSSQRARFASVVTQATTEMLERWRPLADRNEPVDLVTEMRRLTQTIIIRSCFGEIAAAEAEALSRALDVAVGHVDRRLWSPMGWLATPTRATARYRRAVGHIDAFVMRVVSEAHHSTPPADTLLAALLAARVTSEALTFTELRDEIKAILVAGHTTTASALAWIWYVLFDHPDAEERIAAECRGLVGGVPSVEIATDLDYTRRVIEEVLRLYPPTWLTARTPLQNVTIDGYTIPAGTTVLLSPYVTHRHPAFWKAPEVFDPDRFAPACAVVRPPFAYFPFGRGPRHCIGSAFATTELLLIVAAVARCYWFSLLPDARVVPVAGLTLRPAPAMRSRLHRRRIG